MWKAALLPSKKTCSSKLIIYKIEINTDKGLKMIRAGERRKNQSFVLNQRGK